MAMQKKLDVFETWLYRRMLRISWKDMVTNEEVYRRMNIKQSFLVDIVRRQMSFLGHVLRKEEMEHLVVTGFIDGKRTRGRQRETFLTYLGKFTNKPPMELLRLANDLRSKGLSCVQNNNQRLYEDMILIDDDLMLCIWIRVQYGTQNHGKYTWSKRKCHSPWYLHECIMLGEKGAQEG